MPTARQRTVGQPDRVLFLIIIHDKELAGVFVLGHGFLLKTLGERFMLKVAGRVGVGVDAQQEFKRVDTSAKDFSTTVSNVTYRVVQMSRS
jgi:hypothetical protein